MRHLVSRLPGSRTFTPHAMLALLLTVAALVVVAGVLSGIQTTRGSGVAMPLVAVDVQQPAPEPREAAVIEHVQIDRPQASPAASLALGLDLPKAESPQPQVVVEQVIEHPQQSEAKPVLYDGRPLRKAKTITMTVTAYSPDERSCGKWADGRTASGYSVWTNGMKLVAADTRILPFQSLVSVPGYNKGKPVPVLDRGGAIKGHRLDVLYPTHEIAKQWGVQKLEVTVWEYADE